EPEFDRLNKKMARKNLISILIYVAAIPAAFIYAPLALIMIALPAAMYFLPEHGRSEEHTSELQSRVDLVCRLLLEKKKNNYNKGSDLRHLGSPVREPGVKLVPRADQLVPTVAAAGKLGLRLTALARLTLLVCVHSM